MKVPLEVIFNFFTDQGELFRLVVSQAAIGEAHGNYIAAPVGYKPKQWQLCHILGS
jgi:hypothetical protein